MAQHTGNNTHQHSKAPVGAAHVRAARAAPLLPDVQSLRCLGHQFSCCSRVQYPCCRHTCVTPLHVTCTTRRRASWSQLLILFFRAALGVKSTVDQTRHVQMCMYRHHVWIQTRPASVSASPPEAHHVGNLHQEMCTPSLVYIPALCQAALYWGTEQRQTAQTLQNSISRQCHTMLAPRSLCHQTCLTVYQDSMPHLPLIIEAFAWALSHLQAGLHQFLTSF